MGVFFFTNGDTLATLFACLWWSALWNSLRNGAKRPRARSPPAISGARLSKTHVFGRVPVMNLLWRVNIFTPGLFDTGRDARSGVAWQKHSKNRFLPSETEKHHENMKMKWNKNALHSAAGEEIACSCLLLLTGVVARDPGASARCWRCTDRKDAGTSWTVLAILYASWVTY